MLAGKSFGGLGLGLDLGFGQSGGLAFGVTRVACQGGLTPCCLSFGKVRIVGGGHGAGFFEACLLGFGGLAEPVD